MSTRHLMVLGQLQPPDVLDVHESPEAKAIKQAVASPPLHAETIKHLFGALLATQIVAKQLGNNQLFNDVETMMTLFPPDFNSPSETVHRFQQVMRQWSHVQKNQMTQILQHVTLHYLNPSDPHHALLIQAVREFLSSQSQDSQEPASLGRPETTSWMDSEEMANLPVSRDFYKLYFGLNIQRPTRQDNENLDRVG